MVVALISNKVHTWVLPMGVNLLCWAVLAVVALTPNKVYIAGFCLWGRRSSVLDCSCGGFFDPKQKSQ